jgi:hypothetical protein
VPIRRDVQTHFVAFELGHVCDASDLLELFLQDGEVDGHAWRDGGGHNDLDKMALLMIHSVPFPRRQGEATH